MQEATFQPAPYAGLTDEINLGFFELDAEVTAVLWGLSAWLELYRVEFHADDELGIGHTAMYLIYNLKDDTTAVLKTPTILVRTFVGCEREELSKEIAVRAVYLYSVHASFVA